MSEINPGNLKKIQKWVVTWFLEWCGTGGDQEPEREPQEITITPVVGSYTKLLHLYSLAITTILHHSSVVILYTITPVLRSHYYQLH